jgi:hypothetical protein
LFLNEIAIFKNKLFTAAPIFSQGVTIFLPRDDITRFDGMAIINENDKEGWLSSAVVGHTIGNKHEQILRGEGELLKQAGIRMVADLFPHDEITGKLDFKNDRLYDNEHLLPHPQ